VTPVDTQAEEQALVSLAQGDRQQALSILMRAYGPAVYRFCRLALKDAAAADDALQATFVHAFESLSRFRKQSSLLTWLFGIAHHRCLDAARARRRWYQRFGASAEDEIPDPAPSAEKSLNQKAMTSIVLDCLRALPPEFRIAVLMRCQESLSYDEMARMTRERAGTLQMRVTRALPILRACIKGKEVARDQL
jgi:RNA polymerase sigma-70 factor (ECF subfamily)